MLPFRSSLRYLPPKLDHAYLLVNVSTVQARDQYWRPGFTSPTVLPHPRSTDPRILPPPPSPLCNPTVSSPSLIKQPVLEWLFLSFCLALVVNRVCHCLNARKRLSLDILSLRWRKHGERRARFSVKSMFVGFTYLRICVTHKEYLLLCMCVKRHLRTSSFLKQAYKSKIKIYSCKLLLECKICICITLKISWK